MLQVLKIEGVNYEKSTGGRLERWGREEYLSKSLFDSKQFVELRGMNIVSFNVQNQPVSNQTIL
jgi:hypothetical protein